MATGYAAEVRTVIDGTDPLAKVNGAVGGGAQRVFRGTLDLSLSTVKKVVNDINYIARIPVGHVVTAIEVVSSVSLTTSQLAFGVAGSTAKYGAAKAYGTTVDALVTWAKATAIDDDPSVAPQDIFATVTVADLPASGIVTVLVYTISVN